MPAKGSHLGRACRLLRGACPPPVFHVVRAAVAHRLHVMKEQWTMAKSQYNKRYPPEVRERSVRLVLDHQSEYPSLRAATLSFSHELGISYYTLRRWVHTAETASQPTPRVTPGRQTTDNATREGEPTVASRQRDTEVNCGVLRGSYRTPIGQLDRLTPLKPASPASSCAIGAPTSNAVCPPAP